MESNGWEWKTYGGLDSPHLICIVLQSGDTVGVAVESNIRSGLLGVNVCTIVIRCGSSSSVSRVVFQVVTSQSSKVLMDVVVI